MTLGIADLSLILWLILSSFSETDVEDLLQADESDSEMEEVIIMAGDQPLARKYVWFPL